MLCKTNLGQVKSRERSMCYREAWAMGGEHRSQDLLKTHWGKKKKKKTHCGANVNCDYQFPHQLLRMIKFQELEGQQTQWRGSWCPVRLCELENFLREIGELRTKGVL